MAIVHLTREKLGLRPVREAITVRGKELSADDTVAAARRLLANSSVLAIPVLDGTTYIGAIDRAAIRDDTPDSAAVASLVAAILPTATAETPTADALATLDRDGSTRLVILEENGSTYVGLVCLRSDRERLCVDAECHAEATVPPAD